MHPEPSSPSNPPETNVVTRPDVGRPTELVADIEERQLRVARFKPRILLLPAIFLVAITATLWISEIRTGALNLYLSVAWSLYAPLAIIGILGAFRTRRLEVARSDARVGNLVVFVIPTIARGGNMPALRRTVASILCFAPRNLTNFRVDVIADEGAEGIEELRDLYGDEHDVRVVVVPDDYTTPNRTKYKARANHYALTRRDAAGESRPDVFVYHLDDDTSVSSDTIASIAQFIAEDDGSYDLAQGALAFPHDLSSSRFTVHADAIRPADDFTRFQFFTGWIGRPLIGLHGEHLLIRASAESEIGWDFGETKVEDAKFALFFTQSGRRSAFLPGFSYGASPTGLSDFIKQRRRWAGGLIGLAFDGDIAARYRAALAYAALNWAFGPFQHLFVVLTVALALGVVNTSPAAIWILFIWTFNLSYILWQYVEGLRVNLMATQGTPLLWPRALLMVPGIFVFSAVEAYAALLGVYDLATGRTGFEVIDKPS